MNKRDKKDWTSFIIVIPDQHSLIITNPWKPDEYENMWWWKCRDCTASSGVMSTKQLISLEKKGMIAQSDGEDLPPKYSRHPDETDPDYYWHWGM